MKYFYNEISSNISLLKNYREIYPIKKGYSNDEKYRVISHNGDQYVWS